MTSHLRLIELGRGDRRITDLPAFRARPEAGASFESCADRVIVRADDLSGETRRLLERELLRRGGDLFVPGETVTGEDSPASVYLTATPAALAEIADRLAAGADEDPGDLGRRMRRLLATRRQRPRRLHLPHGSISYARGPLIMGILNVTPDSFSDGGEFFDPAAAVERGREMARQGADVVDVGGESTRPGAEEIGVEEELRRVIPVVEALASGPEKVIVSIDTRKSRVARAAIGAGASIVNDISALLDDPEMPEVVGESGVPVILMHMQGEPRTMQEAPSYDDVVAEVYDWLEKRVLDLEAAGLDPDGMVVDPGIGFGKRWGDNLELLRCLEDFHGLGRAIMIGASRKTFLGKILGDVPPEGRLFGSLAVAARSTQAGVQWLRVHDVRETVQVGRVLRAIGEGSGYFESPKARGKAAGK